MCGTWNAEYLTSVQKAPDIRVGTATSFLNSSMTVDVSDMQTTATTVMTRSFAKKTAKLGSLLEVQDSEDPEGLRVMYYLVQDLKVRRTVFRRRDRTDMMMPQCLIFSLISLHFKIKPISV
ncbi:hypothetical protein MGL_1500 [Malassezia globosa CBS 7966]|uniref:Uncharacterized protein n=1 Tax=Malassezia globosa (strain ATCC MYA-4612 / CBS 7966) TaxID=425265 RepID=A8PXQ3_MALGO|nr:uncharacterized protein MGL_1500 [Malassezia globosa CBS 7966]EDP44103.1 hypothetical protein MGL_1500 [Malassezia globosa CBS 7966]